MFKFLFRRQADDYSFDDRPKLFDIERLNPQEKQQFIGAIFGLLMILSMYCHIVSKTAYEVIVGWLLQPL